VAVGAALLGAATKELVVTVPVLVLVYDRVFVSGSFRAAWTSRRGMYLGLLATWVVVALSVWQSETRGGTVGFGQGVTAWDYALTQSRALTMYFKLALWPHPLVLDYGTQVIREAGEVALEGLAVLALLGATIWALVRRPKLGFLGAWCFIILSPSSSFVPLVTQTMAEHRMYLPLAGILVLVTVALRRWLGRAFVPAGLAVATGLGAATVARNHDYRSAEAIWRDTVAKRPDNPRAHYTLAQLADEAGRSAEAIAHGEAAVRLLPEDATAHFNLAFSHAKAGQLEAALTHYERAARLKPESVDAQVNLGAVLVRLGRLDQAIGAYEKVTRAKPDSAEDWFNLGQVYFHAGRFAEAVPPLETAIRLKPHLPESHYRLANTRLRLGQLAAAVAAYRETLRLAPDHFEATVNLAGALLGLGRAREAVPLFERALQLQPNHAAVRAGLERARSEAR
jgi:tetratricopeptide (TPR) repeat protein